MSLALLAMTIMAKPKAVNLTVENMHQPLGLSTHAPRFSWQITDGKKSSVQKSYRILVASRPDLLSPSKADLWDSGTVTSDEQLWLSYAGKKLKDTDRAFWTVMVTTNHGTSEWAAPQEFGIGLTVESHWAGRWIGADRCIDADRQGYRTRLAARYLRKEIKLKAEEIRRATAYIAAVGLYEFYVNGQRQGDHVSASRLSLCTRTESLSVSPFLCK